MSSSLDKLQRSWGEPSRLPINGEAGAQLAALVERVLGTPYHGYLKNLAISLLGKWDSHHHVHFDGGHIKYFSVRTLSAMLEREGFEVERLHYFGRAPGLWKNMIAVARKRE